MNDKDLESVQRKLDIILRLIGKLVLPESSQKDQIMFLNSMELTANEMAEIVDTTPATVRKTLSRLRSSDNSREHGE